MKFMVKFVLIDETKVRRLIQLVSAWLEKRLPDRFRYFPPQGQYNGFILALPSWNTGGTT